MRLAISNFKTRCRVPPRSPLTQDVVDRVVRHGFAAECVRQLNSLPDSGSVVRIRRLPLSLKLKSSDLSEAALVRLWADEFCRALTTVLLVPGTDTGAVVTSESRAAWLARFISHLVAGSAQSRWEYEEFADVLKLGTVDAVLAVLQREPLEIVPVLELLQRQRQLDHMLALFGDLAYEQLFASMAKATPAQDLELSLQDLFTVGESVRSALPVAGILASRRRALLIFLQLAATNESAVVAHWSPRRVLYALIALDTLVNVSQSWPLEMWQQRLTPALLATTARSLNPTILAVLDQVGRLTVERDVTRRTQQLAPLVQLLESLASEIGLRTDAQKQSHFVSGDYVGFLLLVGLIDRFRWPRLILESGLGQRWGSRAITCCLAGLAQHLLEKNIDSDLDPGVAVFAGWLDPASVNRGLLQTVLSSASDEDRAQLIETLTGTPSTEDKTLARDWTTTFGHLGTYLLREFASRIRGFRKATPASIVNTFLKQPGRIMIHEELIHVTLPPNPFHVALHLSAVDETIDAVTWLDNRRLQFQLEGL